MSERKTREAVVISDKMQKTRVVRIERVHRHPRYQRVVRSAKRLKVHDEANASRVGDRVLIEETRPMSKEKRWRIRQIVKVNAAARALAVPGAATPTLNRPPTAQGEQALR
ncbi:MAG: 30S ribosomal protein S17 [Candidatus Rokuibacteriota bacterium]